MKRVRRPDSAHSLGLTPRQAFGVQKTKAVALLHGSLTLPSRTQSYDIGSYRTHATSSSPYRMNAYYGDIRFRGSRVRPLNFANFHTNLPPVPRRPPHTAA